MTLSDPAERHQRIKQLFLEACRRDPEDRAAFLDEACGSDGELRREVQSLLAHHQPGSSFLDPVLEPGVLADATVFFRAAARDAEAEVNASTTSTQLLDQGRFEPGSLINDRYRITALLGRGGMGDVYRADDLTLGQTVALKFLPSRLQADTRWLDRFHNEVRMARQIAHPNVCRVYDVGYCNSVKSASRVSDSSRGTSLTDPPSQHDVDAETGQVFISMEYVDGEDLASLLRRIGRLPKDKAIQIARQLCSGLAAAHNKNVLHRDLKPTNVMIDGRGQVRITDFGLAAPMTGLTGVEIRAGTPAYMAPEQLTGKEVSVRSDLYSLGLVLYEMFTGRPPFKGSNAREYERLHSTATPAHPSHIIEDMDDAVERVILRCIEKDPRQRPGSALAVMAALPGGDPLAAALEAGETPSPEMVAAAGEVGVVHSPIAMALLAASLIGMMLAVFLASHVTLINRVPLPRPPEVLASRAEDIIRSLGYTAEPTDRVYGFSENKPLLDFIEQLDVDDSLQRWDRLKSGQPAAVHFWYRQSPHWLVPTSRAQRATLADPPPSVPGMVNVVLDPHGRLVEFQAVPQVPDNNLYAQTTDDNVPPPDWRVAFEAADLNFENFIELPPKRLPTVYASRRMTWIGQYGSDPPVVLEIDAAAYNGRIVYFSLMPPWRAQLADSETAASTIAPRGTATRRMQQSQMVQSSLFVIGLAFGSLLAYRNLKSGRGDRRGAFRVAAFIFAASLLEILLRATHVPQFLPELALFGEACGHALYRAAQIWIFYMALEPFLRRVWPETIIAWSRLLTGRFRDPLIGRDVLIGGAIATWSVVIVWVLHLSPELLAPYVPAWVPRTIASLPQFMQGAFEITPARPAYESTDDLMRLMGARYSLAHFAEMQFQAVFYPLLYLLVLLLLRVTVRKPWLMIGIFVLVVSSPTLLGPNWIIRWPVMAGLMTLMTYVLIRHGLVALMAAVMIFTLLNNFPLTPNTNAWFALTGYAALAAAAGMCIYAFYVSQAGRPLLREELL